MILIMGVYNVLIHSQQHPSHILCQIYLFCLNFCASQPKSNGKHVVISRKRRIWLHQMHLRIVYWDDSVGDRMNFGQNDQLKIWSKIMTRVIPAPNYIMTPFDLSTKNFRVNVEFSVNKIFFRKNVRKLLFI